MTQALATLCDDLDTRPNGFVVQSARRVLGRSESLTERTGKLAQRTLSAILHGIDLMLGR